MSLSQPKLKRMKVIWMHICVLRKTSLKNTPQGSLDKRGSVSYISEYGCECKYVHLCEGQVHINNKTLLFFIFHSSVQFEHFKLNTHHYINEKKLSNMSVNHFRTQKQKEIPVIFSSSPYWATEIQRRPLSLMQGQGRTQVTTPWLRFLVASFKNKFLLDI